MAGGPMALLARAARAPPPPHELVRMANRLQSQFMQGQGAAEELDAAVEEIMNRQTLLGLKDWLSSVSPEIMEAIKHAFESIMPRFTLRIDR